MTSWVWGFTAAFTTIFFPAKHGGHDSVPSATSRGGHLERGGPRRSGGGGRQLLPFRGPVFPPWPWPGFWEEVSHEILEEKVTFFSDRYSEHEFFF